MAALDDNDDDEMVRRALGGDESAWGRLVEKYRVYGYRLAWRVTFNEEDALDAVQEMLLKMSTKLADFRGRGALRSWVATIAVREAALICRRRGKAPMAMDPELVSLAADGAVGAAGGMAHPGEALDRRRRMGRVHEAMERLSPQQRAILLLGVENDIGPAEIARELGLPANQVRSQQARGIARLREILNESDDESVQKTGRVCEPGRCSE